MTPADIVLVPFIPFALVWKPSEALNKNLEKLQYFVLLFIYYSWFMMGSMLMIPIAYGKSIVCKAIYIRRNGREDKRKLVINCLELFFFIWFGLPILILNFFADTIYFYLFNMYDDVSTNEVTKQASLMTFDTCREIMYICQRFIDEKINSVHVNVLIRIFR